MARVGTRGVSRVFPCAGDTRLTPRVPRVVSRIAALLLLAASSPLAAESIDGHVVERLSRAPIASAEIRILKAGDARLTADIETDVAGRFSLADLPRATTPLKS